MEKPHPSEDAVRVVGAAACTCCTRIGRTRACSRRCGRTRPPPPRAGSSRYRRHTLAGRVAARARAARAATEVKMEATAAAGTPEAAAAAAAAGTPEAAARVARVARVAEATARDGRGTRATDRDQTAHQAHQAPGAEQAGLPSADQASCGAARAVPRALAGGPPRETPSLTPKAAREAGRRAGRRRRAVWRWRPSSPDDDGDVAPVRQIEPRALQASRLRSIVPGRSNDQALRASRCRPSSRSSRSGR